MFLCNLFQEHCVEKPFGLSCPIRGSSQYVGGVSHLNVCRTISWYRNSGNMADKPKLQKSPWFASFSCYVGTVWDFLDVVKVYECTPMIFSIIFVKENNFCDLFAFPDSLALSKRVNS